MESSGTEGTSFHSGQLLYNATSDSNTAETRVMERLLRNAHTHDKDRFAPEYSIHNVPAKTAKDT